MNHIFGAGSTGIRKEIEDLSFSPIREIVRTAADRNDIIPFWFGEPDVSTPDFIRNAAKDSLDRGETFYAPNSGIMLLREAIADYMNGLYGKKLSPSNITVSASGMNALMIVAETLIRPGSRVVVLTPSWPNIPAVQEILGAEIIRVSMSLQDQGWDLDMDRLMDACDSNTSVIVINSPNNPSGWMMKTEDQQALLERARLHGTWIVSDEVYARITYGSDRATSFCDLTEEDDRIIVVNSFSKSWAMTGWRLGWITAPANLESQFEKLTEYNIAGPPPFVQHAGITALKEGESFIRESRMRYQKRRDRLGEWVKSQPRLVYASPEAAFYAFFEIRDATDSLGMAKDLLRKKGVGLAPGCAFGPEYDSFLRLCLATSEARLESGLERLGEWLKNDL